MIVILMIIFIINSILLFSLIGSYKPIILCQINLLSLGILIKLQFMITWVISTILIAWLITKCIILNLQINWAICSLDPAYVILLH